MRSVAKGRSGRWCAMEVFGVLKLELDLDVVGYYSLISLPLGHAAAEQALQMAAKRGAMKPLKRQVGPGACGAGANEGRQPGPHAGGGGGPGTAGGAETRHRGGAAQSEGGRKQVGPTRRGKKDLAQQPRATGQEDAGSRTSVEIRGNRDRWRRQAADIALACGCRVAPPDGEDPTGAAGAVHGSSPVEHGPDRAGVPRSVAGRRTVPQGGEGWRSALGTVASVGGWVDPATHI